MNIDTIYPPSLKPGDRIGVFAPSSYVEKDDIEKSKALLEQRGYEVFIHPQTYERHNQSAGTHLQKSLAFQGLFMRDDINAIWAAGGGNRALHLLETINFTKLKDRPKLLLGFSDITALLNANYAHNKMVGIHTQVFKNLHKYEQLDHLLDMLAGQKTKIPFNDAKILHHGKATGHLIGGNLSIFQYLPQTLPGEFYDGAILFLEECNEELSKIDRMLLHLRRTGTLAKISALALGQFTDITESGRPFGFAREDIVREHTEYLDIPVITDLPFGHTNNMHSLPIGTRATIDTKKKILTLDEPAVRI